MTSPRSRSFEPRAAFTITPGSRVRISQVYGSGGNSGALYTNDYVELYNAGVAAADLSTLSIQYASATGTGNFGGTASQLVPLSGTVQPGHYFLIQLAGGTTGSPLPTPDLIAGSSNAINMSGTAGRVALVDGAASLGCNGGSTACTPAQLARIIDLVGYGTGTNFYEGSGPAPTISSALADFRKDLGRQDTDDNSNDFTAATPAPRNSSSYTQPPQPLVATISPASPLVAFGTPITLHATATNLGQPVTITDATWTVDNTDAVTSVTAAAGDPTTATAPTAAPGTATVTVVATTSAGPATGTVVITVTKVPNSVSLSPAISTLKTGAKTSLIASALDVDGKPAATTYTWTTDNSAVATVDANGSVTGVGVGTTMVHATSSNGIVGDATINVSNMSIAARTVPLPAGFQFQPFANGTLGDGSPITTLTWSTSDATIATVDPSTGVVTAVSGGSGSQTVTITARATDGSIATTPVTVETQKFSSTVRSGHNTEFGTPTDHDPSDDVIIVRKQYTVSYSPNHGGANWVSWDLSSTHLGSVDRCNCYSADTALLHVNGKSYPAYTTNDWISGGKYDRGHMEPSADQTTTDTENGETFFLTNFLPQTHALNAGVWEQAETAMRDSARAGREVYQIAGGIFTGGVGLGPINAAGHIYAPDSTWKIAILLPAGKGLADVADASDIDVIALNMPNATSFPAGAKWTDYKTTVAKIQKSTGYDFLSALPEAIQCQVEGRPCARIGGTGVNGGNEGQKLSFVADASSIPAGDQVAYSWTVDGAAVGSAATLDYTFVRYGTFTVGLTISDLTSGAATSASTTVIVQDVAPTVSSPDAATILQGETYTSAGSFADPGANTWTGSVNYGDGTGSSTLALSGKSFQLTHAYSPAGTFTVTATINDGSLSGSGSAQVVVQTPTQGIINLSNSVDLLATLGGASVTPGATARPASLTDGEINSLKAKLDNAAAQLAKGQNNAAQNILGAFINEMKSMIDTGRVPSTSGSAIINYAQRVIASIGR